MIAIMVCDDCDTQMEEVFTAQENFKLKGWMCPSCLHFVPAIGRERLFTKGEQDGDKERSSGQVV